MTSLPARAGDKDQPLVHVAAAGVLTIFASTIPARRVLRVDATTALRAQQE